MKKILGLDLGTNSIGWAVINAEVAIRDNATTFLKPYAISSAGSRIIPMSADILGDFDKGNSISQTAERTRLRMARRLRERNVYIPTIGNALAESQNIHCTLYY